MLTEGTKKQTLSWIESDVKKAGFDIQKGKPISAFKNTAGGGMKTTFQFMDIAKDGEVVANIVVKNEKVGGMPASFLMYVLKPGTTEGIKLATDYTYNGKQMISFIDGLV